MIYSTFQINLHRPAPPLPFIHSPTVIHSPLSLPHPHPIPLCCGFMPPMIRNRLDRLDSSSGSEGSGFHTAVRTPIRITRKPPPPFPRHLPTAPPQPLPSPPQSSTLASRRTPPWPWTSIKATPRHRSIHPKTFRPTSAL